MLCFILPSCNTSNENENFSEVQLDSNQLNRFLANDSALFYVAVDVKQFYNKRNHVFAWFSDGNLNPTGLNFYNQLQNSMYDFGDSTLFDPKLDSVMSLDIDDLDDFAQKNANQEMLEIKLTVSYFRYSKNEIMGKVQNIKNLDWFIPRKKQNIEGLLDSLLENDKKQYLTQPANLYYSKLKSELKKYLKIERTKSWPVITIEDTTGSDIQLDSEVIGIKKILRLGGDWVENDTSAEITKTFKQAIIHYQNRVGLAENGLLDKATLKSLRIPVQHIVKQIVVNLERLRWLPDTIPADFILVNIPEYKMHVFENGKPSWQSNVVVGKAAGRTQVFRGNLSQIVLNPSWGIPPGIAKNEVLPGIKKDISYLEKHEMEVYSGNTKVNPHKINWDKIGDHIPYNFRQTSGGENPLGQFKFFLSNSFWIYLHDSNEKYLFDDNKRALSHGCIRVEKARQLAEYLLNRQNLKLSTKSENTVKKKNALPIWNTERLNKLLNNTEDYGISIEPSLPVYIVYFTAWVNQKGELNLRNDIYKKDPILANAILEN